MIPILFTILAILICLGFSFFFSGSETAIYSINKYRLRSLHEQGDATAGKLLGLLANTRRLVVMVLIGTNLANVLAALFFKLLIEQSVPVIADREAIGLVPWSDLLDLLILTPIVLILAEIIPKVLFRQHADQLLTPLRPVFVVCLAVMRPAIIAVEGLTRLLLAPLGKERLRKIHELTRQDVIDLVAPDANGNDAADEDQPVGLAMAAEIRSENERIEEATDERRLIHNIITLQETCVYEIMRPLVELVAVQLGRVDLEGFKQIAAESGHTRLPVYRDRIVNLIGSVDLYRVLCEDDGTRTIESFVEPAHFIPESKRVDDLLQEFLRLRIKNAIVVDEYGGCSGWVSREDMIEEIVGEIEDELDEPAMKIAETADGAFLIEGRMEIDAVNEALGSAFSEEEGETLAGLILSEMGRIPKEGNAVTIDDWRATVVRMEGHRVDQVRLEPSRE